MKKFIRKTTIFFLSSVMAAGLFTLPARAATAGAVTLTEGNLNVRSARSATSSVAATLPDGSYVTLIARSGDWWQVEYTDGKFGYCHRDYITPIEGSPATVDISYGSLNVRSGPGSGYARRAALYKGEEVVLLSSSGSWSRILYHGTHTGWVSSQYLSTAAEASAAPASALAVTDYKQYDSRWSSVKIGGSGKTMRQIGCTTTAIAMMESYRLGRAVTPADMAWQLSYTPSGSVYWPEHYTVTTSSANYLGKIARLLSSGKPVLFGAKKANGGQHWVVIDGYNGKGLTPANFSINDPGSSSRTNLQQFLNAYPYFYKYFNY